MSDFSHAELPPHHHIFSGMLCHCDPNKFGGLAQPKRAATEDEFALAQYRGLVRLHGLARIRSLLDYIEKHPEAP